MAVKPIIISLVADTSGLQVGIDALEALGKVDKSTADQFRGANKAFQDRGKVLEESITSTDKFAAASKKLVESIAGGAIAQAAQNIKKISDQADNASKEFQIFAQVVQKAKAQLSSLQEGTPAFIRLTAEIEAAELAMSNFTTEATSSRGQLRQYREALIQLEEAGLENTKVFNDMAVAAGQLQDQVGDTQARIKALASDTFALDAGIQAVRGLAGAFSVAQGAAALLGNEDEDLQKALLKVNAAMAILNGLQEVQNILQKETALSVAATLAIEKLKTLQTNLAAAAESRYTIVRYAATAAQTVLNAVMAANPAGVVLVALGALATALIYFTSKTDDATKAQEAYNEKIKVTTESLKNQAEFTNLLVNGYQNEIDLLRAKGAARSVVAAAEAASIKQQIKDQRELQKELIGRSGGSEEYTKSVAKQAELRGQLRVKEVEVQKALLDESTEAAKKAAETNKKNLDRFLQDQVAANEAAVLSTSDGFEKLFAQIQLVEAKLRQTLANPTLTVNERVAAELKAGEEIKKLREDLFRDLEKAEYDHNTRLTKADDERVLNSAKNAQELLAIQQKQAQDELKIIDERIEKEKQKRLEIRDAVLGLAVGLSQSATEIAQNQANAELAILQDRLDKGLISQEAYDKQVKAIRRRQAIQEKQMALFQAIINTAAAVVKALPNIPLSVIAGILGAAQIAAIQSRPIPAFAKGTKHKPNSGPALIGEAGPELFYANGKFGYADKPTILNLPKGAKVIPTLETGKILERYNIPIPNVQQNVSTTYGGIKIDYSKMAALIGKEIGKLPLQNNVWDGDGFSQYQISLSQRKSYLNKRYSSK